MLYCCGSKDEEKVSTHLHTDTEPETTRESATQPREMYGIVGMPELLPPSGVLQPSPVSPGEPGEVPGLGTRFNRGVLSFDSPQRRLGQRAPKLGQIGRSKKVVIEDEDLDDIMNNNDPLFPTSLNLSPVA